MPENSDDTVLRFEDVSLSFDEDEKAIDNVSFRVTRGETRIVFGAAGSGKSVLLKLAIGLLKPDSGRIFLFGQDITQMNEHELYPVRAKAGVLFQEGGLFDSMTIEENVEYPLLYQQARVAAHGGGSNGYGERIREALRFVELEQTLTKFPSELSGGMRRRVGIARAMVTEPPLMLYDSPTAGLDPITANTIIALIVKARDTRSTTNVIVTHRHQDGRMLANFRYNPQSGSVERIADPRDKTHTSTTFMVLQAGRIAFEGTEEQLDRTEDPYVAKFKVVKS
jgi:phospholipid/cholesterol/gamma-HCH transport system ATP-binding protein